jgi:opacity protein-like surface antigen
MINFLMNRKSWISVSLLLATSGFSQSACEPCCEPHELLQCPTRPIYSAPARIDIQCGWDVWVDASFIYWQAIQENMEPTGWSAPFTLTVGGNDLARVNMGFKYKPGFKVGAGMSFDYDNWDVAVEYTRLHGTYHRAATLDSALTTAGYSYRPQQWANAFNAPASGAPLTQSFNATWKLNLDFLDIDLGRWYYEGTQVTFRPSIGMRAAWINQHRHANYSSTLVAFNIYDIEKTSSWGIGPRLGVDANWMIGEGFRFFGSSELDVLYTRYHARINTTNSLNGADTLETGMEQSDVNALRPHVDLELGLGWGTYLDCHKWHLDVSASYGYQVFWNQNMFRLVDSPRYVMPNGDLFVHGLTATVKLDF